MNKESKNGSVANRMKINISAKVFAIIVFVIALVADVLVYWLFDHQSFLFSISTTIIGVILSSAAIGFIIEIFSLDKIIKDTSRTTVEQSKSFYDSNIDSISNKIAQNIDVNFLEYLNAEGQDEFLKKYLYCQYQCIKDENYRNELVESNFSIQKKVVQHHMDCELFSNYEETITISVEDEICAIQRNISFKKYVLDEYYTYQKVIWFSSEQNRDSLDKNSILVTIGKQRIERDDLHIENIANESKDEYGVRISFVLRKGIREVSISYKRDKPIAETPVFCIFSFVVFEPKITLVLSQNEYYKLDVAVMRNYEHFNNNEEFLLRGEVINNNNIFDIRFPGWCLPGCGIVFWLQKKEDK